ncbi:MAG: ATP-binding protein [Oscillospiraceae bacterium]|nr:ATP-binding protein [Oscillospiraceae bacterium]
MKLIERSALLDRLSNLRGTPDIKIITGIRRSGKSQLMKDFIDRIRAVEPDVNIIVIDYVDLAFEDLKEYHALYRYIEDHYVSGTENILFIDEVQMCPGFELTVSSLHASGRYDIYLTGSNAFLLSNDLATLFTGRFLEIHVFPFSFREFIDYFGGSDIDLLFDDYVRKGGLPGSYPYKNEQDRVAYIQDVYGTIINRDLMQKYRLNDSRVLGHLADYLMDNVSNLSSPNRISNTLNANEVSASHVTVGRYIRYLCNAFAFYDVKRYDIRGKKYLETSDKYYLSDTGIRFAQLGTRNMDFGRMYENIVAIELLRRGYEVYVGKLYEKEVDFVALRGSEKLYIQVSDNIQEAKTFQREIEPLMRINDAYPKMILARTHHEETDYEGIRIVDLPTWLIH